MRCSTRLIGATLATLALTCASASVAQADTSQPLTSKQIARTAEVVKLVNTSSAPEKARSQLSASDARLYTIAATYDPSKDIVTEQVAAASPATVQALQDPQYAVNGAAEKLAASAAAAVSPDCWTTKAWREGRSAAGNTLWKMYTVGSWCERAGTMYSAKWEDSGGQPIFLGWSHRGLLKKDAGVISNEGRSYSQHGFTYGWQSLPAQNPEPCLRIEGKAPRVSTGKGVFSYSFTCGKY